VHFQIPITQESHTRSLLSLEPVRKREDVAML
jgi:hypothetical protein